jgi:16S rRNA (guanine966-N2)-methyltransferase
VRIIAGERRGARIAAPKGLATRPTGDRVREAAYNLIGPVDAAAVLDLFAGSGAMGLEALSRGARRCVFVESDRDACATIRRNLEKLRFTGALVLCEDVFKALREERAAGREHDLVLVDAPYEAWAGLEPRLAEMLPAVLARDGQLVVETSSRIEPALPLESVTSRRYGSARITIFTR